MNTEKHKAGFPTQSANHSTPNVNRPSPNTNHQISRTKSCGLQRCVVLDLGFAGTGNVLCFNRPLCTVTGGATRGQAAQCGTGRCRPRYAPTEIPALYRYIERNFVARTCPHRPAQEHQCWLCGPGQSPKRSVILKSAALGPQITPPRLRGEPWGTPSVEVRSNRLLARTPRQSLATPVNRFRVYDTGYRIKA
jgi:hypothetical protein